MTKSNYAPANGRSFKIVERDGKAPFKVVMVSPEGNERDFSFHKTKKLALEKCHTFNPGIPVHA